MNRTTFKAKGAELRVQRDQIHANLQGCDQDQDENSKLAVKAFELSQDLVGKWPAANYAAKRQLLEIVCLNLQLDDTTLVAEVRRQFDILLTPAFKNAGGGEGIPVELFAQGALSLGAQVQALILAA